MNISITRHDARKLGRSGTVMLTAWVALGVAPAVLVPSAALAANGSVSPDSEWCDPYTTRSYIPDGFEWDRYDSGTVHNPSAGTVAKSYTHTFNASLTTTVSAEVGITAGTAVAEINAKLGISVAVTASVTTSSTFSVSVPPYRTVSYKDGLAKRHYRVKTYTVYSNCGERTTWGSVTAADNFTWVVDA
jgi:hypothetical protein